MQTHFSDGLTTEWHRRFLPLWIGFLWVGIGPFVSLYRVGPRTVKRPTTSGNHSLLGSGSFLVVAGPHSASDLPWYERHGGVDIHRPRFNRMGRSRLDFRIWPRTGGQYFCLGAAVRHADSGCNCLYTVQRLGQC